MATDDKQPNLERQQTDESLRAERDKADRAIGEELAAIDEAADEVISKARERADEVLAKARAQTDRRPQTSDSQSPAFLERRRQLEDEALRRERAKADDVLREERTEHVALISIEREETDKDLFSERARADNAIATRDSFLGIVSHDLRNMLNAMVGFAGLIASASREGHPEQFFEWAQRIQRSGARMNRLIGDLVDVASIDAGMLAVTREVGDPARIVTEAVDTLQAQALASGVSLTAQVVPPPSLAAFDPARILQVLINLLGNAIKFTPAKGTVVVRVERIGDEILFAVRDTGMGIPADKLEAVFERFIQITKDDRRGVGLGLYISKCIISGHGGRIWAESQIGQGSTFCFTLPIHTPRS